ncbi:diguanylate cyclase domain-containing protein [Shewanella dokdonensis]|uniref:Sensor domain-containing diguanylate cyclase n=1 Tax=Shewanella dokdonensis TaxID=712036 RepID=A0ABX8DAG9_9GAMM|nr:diguanylate cyclase [Shewanella dokdonensis]MCL1075727.1 sensor domain-containing diguanylate cyclase [Shewanella dokdonensis]QVK21879.1 sensor domain-containing diguanylate cyclase [Shewanella dokdonensis]
MRNYRGIISKSLWGILALCYFAVTYEVVEYLQRSYSRDIAEDRADDLSRQLALVRYRLEASVTAEVFQANALASYISVSPHSTPQQWLPLARGIIRKAIHIRNIAVAPDDVISFVFPLAGNEKVLGLDFRETSQWRTVQLARQQQNIFIAGPLTLVQGGEGLVVRIPIFSDPPANTHYWGVCSVALDWHRLLHDAGSDSFPDDIELAMRGVDGLGPLGAVFYGDPAVFLQPLRSETVNLVSGVWELAIRAIPSNSTELWFRSNLVRLLGYTLSFVLFGVVMLLLNAYRNARRYFYEDVLTKISNRRRAMRVLDKLQKHGSHFCIFNIDLNNFKQINDTYGHVAGDALLIEIAARLERELRGSDMVARIGGDEFLVILPRISDTDSILAIQQKIMTQVCAPDFSWRGLNLPIQMSMGYACYPKDADDIEELLHIADRAMYLDKQQHRGREAR